MKHPADRFRDSLVAQGWRCRATDMTTFAVIETWEDDNRHLAYVVYGVGGVSVYRKPDHRELYDLKWDLYPNNGSAVHCIAKEH
jgi:hypothetical protein